MFWRKSSSRTGWMKSHLRICRQFQDFSNPWSLEKMCKCASKLLKRWQACICGRVLVPISGKLRQMSRNSVVLIIHALPCYSEKSCDSWLERKHSCSEYIELVFCLSSSRLQRIFQLWLCPALAAKRSFSTFESEWTFSINQKFWKEAFFAEFRFSFYFRGNFRFEVLLCKHFFWYLRELIVSYMMNEW